MIESFEKIQEVACNYFEWWSLYVDKTKVELRGQAFLACIADALDATHKLMIATGADATLAAGADATPAAALVYVDPMEYPPDTPEEQVKSIFDRLTDAYQQIQEYVVNQMDWYSHSVDMERVEELGKAFVEELADTKDAVIKLVVHED